MKKYRFFFHYFRQKDKWSVHFRNKCYIVDNFVCLAECEGKTNKRQPYRIAQGFASQVKVKNNIAYIQ